MVKTIRAFFLSFTILAFLLFSTIGTTTVYADDGTGTETPETETATEEATPANAEEQPPADEDAPAGEDEQPAENPVTDVEQPAGNEDPPVEATEQPAEESVEETATEEPIQTILEQLPENTTVTVLNSEGETLPLASQDSADAIASDYDPIWCPDGQVPTPGANGCTQSFNSFDELLAFLQANENDAAYQQAGTIFIQQGEYLGGESEIDFNAYNFNQLNNYDLTLQGGWDTTYDPAVDGEPTYTSTSFNAPIIIGSSTNPWVGSLTLNNISISGVTSQTGLTLHTSGVIDLDQVEVTNSQAGMDLNAGDEINLTNVNASNNEEYGARIRGDQVAIDTATFNNNGSTNGPDGYGVDVGSLSLVALVRVTADNNQTFGANIFAGDLVAISQSAFRQNGGTGVKVLTTLGAISLNQVTADGNYEYGANLQGVRTTVENSSFSENGSGEMTDPSGYGLKIVSSEQVILRDVTANENQFFGADIQAVGLIDIQNSFFSGHQSMLLEGVDNEVCSGYQVEVADWVDLDFCGYGLKVVTSGDIFLDNVTGNFNNLWGAWLDGNNVSVYNSQFNDNVTNSQYFVDDTGMLIFASGYVDIFRTEALRNRLYGAKIVSDSFVSIVESDFTDNRGFICLDGYCGEDTREYFGVGLDVTAQDFIFMRDTNVSNNNLFGALLNGLQVDIENSTFNNNMMGNGLIINATDNVTLAGVSAVNNGGDGVEVNGVCEKIVQVTGGTFSNNLLYGLNVLNATLTLDGAQTFVNNGSGNVFTDTSTCVVIVPTITTTTTTGQLMVPTLTASSEITNSEIQTSPDTTNLVSEPSTVDSETNQVITATISISKDPAPNTKTSVIEAPRKATKKAMYMQNLIKRFRYAIG